MNFKSITQLLDFFKDEETCIEYYENIRWAGEPVCPHCESSKKPYKTTRGYKCSNNECYKKFNVKTKTIFENSNIKLRTWFAAIFLCTTSKKGVSSVQLADQLDVTQKTAWFILHRVREMLKEKSPAMLGENNPVEVDESYVGGKEKNKHFSKRRSLEGRELKNDGTPYQPKKTVIGIVERSGNVVLKYLPNATQKGMEEFIKTHVPNGSKIYTDESKYYHKLSNKFDHEAMNHSAQVYVVGDAHSNTIESFWATLKRGIYGIYHQVSDKHIEAYLNEFAARYNNRHNGNEEKFQRFLAQSESRLRYSDLIS